MPDLLIAEPGGSQGPRLVNEPKSPVPFVSPAAAPPPGYPPTSEPPGGGDVHLSDYLRVLYKRRWPFLTAFLLVFLGTCIYTFTATPIYNARVQILIEKEASNVVTFKEAVEQNQVTDDYYQTQYKILQSRALARRTLDTLQLWQHTQFTGGDANQSRGLRSIVGTLSSKKDSVRDESPSPEETKAQSRTIDQFLQNLTVLPIRNSRLVDVTYESTDPVLAAKVANGVAAAYIEQNLEYKFLSSKEASDWLAKRLGEQRKQVEGTEQAL